MSAVTFTNPSATCASGFAERGRTRGGVRSVRVPVEKVHIDAWPSAFPGAEASDEVAFTWNSYCVPTARLPLGRKVSCLASVDHVVGPAPQGPPAPFRPKAAAVFASFIGSDQLTWIRLFRSTWLAPAAGEKDRMVGGAESTVNGGELKGCEAPLESWTTTRITVSVELNPLGVHGTIWGFVGPAAQDLIAWRAPLPSECEA